MDAPTEVGTIMCSSPLLRAAVLSLAPCDYETDGGALEAECGTLVVPENRDDPDSRLIALPVTRIAARSNDPGEPIFRLDSWLSAADGDASGLWFMSFLANITVPESFVWGEATATGCTMPDSRTPTPRAGIRARSWATREPTSFEVKGLKVKAIAHWNGGAGMASI